MPTAELRDDNGLITTQLIKINVSIFSLVQSLIIAAPFLNIAECRTVLATETIA